MVIGNVDKENVWWYICKIGKCVVLIFKFELLKEEFKKVEKKVESKEVKKEDEKERDNKLEEKNVVLIDEKK